ncbi:MAG TPA: PAS domain S-box protein [Gallionella sp.]|nr:PAS domain S-box protein [Gallionella sp.]
MPASIADSSLESSSAASKDALMQLERKLLDLAFGKVKFSVISALLLASLIVIALWSVIEHERLLAWLAGIAGIKALHFLYLQRYKRHGHRADIAPGTWKTGLVAGAAATGLGWGSAVFCFPSSPFNPLTLLGVFVLPSTPFDPVTVLLIFILAGVTAYASVAMAFVPLAAFAFFACAWLPLAIWLFSFGEQMYVVMGLIALSYLGVMVLLSRRMYATVCSLISVTEENRGLRTAQQESDWRMQRFFESAPGFFYTACMSVDGKSTMPFASSGIHELFDLASGDVADSMSPLFSLVRAEDIERVIKAREESRRNLSPFHIEFRINHRIKGERWIELHSLPQREPDGSTNWHGFMQDITGRKGLEESLAAREREFRTLAENFPDVVIRYDLDGRRTYVNRALAELAGTEPDEMLGKFLEDTPLVDPEAYVAELRRVIATRDAAVLEVAARGTKGEISWYQARFVPEFDAGDNVSGVLMVAGDITQRRRMEHELQQRETDFRTLAENLPVAVIRYDAEQRRRYLNPAAERMLHGNMAELLGKVPGDGGVPATPAMIERYRNKMAEVLASGETCEFEFVLDVLSLERQDSFEVRFAPERDAEGNVVGVLANWYDITERRQAQQRMELLEHAIGVSSDAIYLVDDELRFSYVNDTACGILGYTREELLVMGPQDIDPGISREIAKNVMETSTVGAPVSFETQHRTKDGRIFPVELHGIHFERGGRKFGLSVVRDITERKRMEMVLAARERDFRSLAENLPDNIARWDVEGRYLYINPTHERTLGVAASEVIGKPIPDTHEHVKAAIAQVVASGRSVELVRQAALVNGELQVHEVTLVPEFDAAGHVVSVLGLGRNMTEFYRMQDAIAEREQLVRSVVDATPDWIFIKDQEHRYRLVNQSYADALHLDPDDFIGKTDLDLGFPEELVKGNPEKGIRGFWTDDRLVMDSNATQIFPDDPATIDGVVHTFHTIKVPLRDVDGKAWGVLAFARDITERKQIELALRASKEQAQSRSNLLNAIVESSPDVIVFALDTQYRYLSFNRKHQETMRAIWGKEIAAGMSMLDVIGDHPDREKAKRGFDHALSGESFVQEEAYGDELLSRQYWQNYWSPIRAETGEVVGLTCFVMNVTERRRIEEAMRANEEKLGTLFALSPLGIALTDMDGRYVEFNEAFRAICGYPSDELMALDYWTLTPREYEAQEAAQLESLMQTGRYGPYEKEYRQKDGTLVPIQLNGVLVTGQDGKQYIWSIVEDITERKKTEAVLKERFERIVELNDYLEENARTLEEHAVELEASQEQLKEALEFSSGVINAIPDILFEMDREGRYHGIWTQKPELLAAQKALLLNKTLHEVLPRETADIALAAIREADEKGAAYGKVIAIAQANGGVRWFEHSISRKQGGSPSDVRFIVLSRDVTERKQTEDVLRFVAEGEWMRGGESFLDALVRYLGKSLGVDYVVIDKVADEPGYVETVARYVKGEIAPNVRYALQSTPCGEVMAGVHCCHGENIQGLFPEAGLLKNLQVESYAGIPLRDIGGAVIGLIAVLDGKPLADAHFVKSILQMVASSVSAELERSRMEQVLRENYDALNEAQRISHIGNWELDLASGELLWSDEIYRIFEIDQERFGASYDAFLNAIHPDDRDAVVQAYETSLETRSPYEIEHRLLFADGRIKYVHERCETRYDEGGKPLRSLGTVQDITARKQAEDSLRESYDKISELNRHLEKNAVRLEQNARYLEEQATELEASQEQLKQTEAWYRSILHSAPEGMLVVDDRGLIMQVNARLEAMFGYESGELPGHRVEVLLPQAVRGNHAGQRAGYFASGAASRPAMVGKTLFGCRKDGSTFPVDVSLSRLPDLDGRRSAVCASVRDITERQAMEAARETALAEAQRLAQLRSAFMAQMSHELRTPLNGILGYAQNLLQGDALGEKQVAGLNIIQHSGEHLLSLINGLLDHAAIEANKFELIEGDIELDSFLSAIVGIIRVKAEQKNLAFTCEAGGDLPAVVRGDAQRLRQVLINLLANAVKFTDSGSVILRVRMAASSRIRFEVQDSGVGIAADQLENIFLPFEQAGELQRRAGGSGLGLAISRTLVRLMGGDIRVESRPGAGSTFSFEIEIGVVQSGRAGIDAAALSERAETRVAQAMPMLPAPSRQELDTLHALALRGSMRDVTRHADRLAEADARYQPFAAQLRRLAQSFQTKALLGLIEQYRNWKIDE